MKGVVVMAISFMTDRAGIRSLGFLASAAAADFRQAAQRRKMRDVLRLQLAVERFCESKGPVPSRMPSYGVSRVVAEALGSAEISALIRALRRRKPTDEVLSFLGRLSTMCVNALTAARIADGANPDAT